MFIKMTTLLLLLEDTLVESLLSHTILMIKRKELLKNIVVTKISLKQSLLKSSSIVIIR